MEEKDIYAELSSIRSLMERSSKFISLSGLSGVLAGIYALAGAAAVRFLEPEAFLGGQSSVSMPIVGIALGVLLLSIGTCCWLTLRRAGRTREKIWNPVSKRLLAAVGVPLVSGGLFILILLYKANVELILPACLLFYGLALVAGSHYTYTDIKWLGLCDIALGLLALLLPQYGLQLWVTGFGFLHILYGSIMHFKYQR